MTDYCKEYTAMGDIFFEAQMPIQKYQYLSLLLDRQQGHGFSNVYSIAVGNKVCQETKKKENMLYALVQLNCAFSTGTTVRLVDLPLSF